MVDRLIVVQSGVVQLSIPYDKRVANQDFVIERLIPGAILNHLAFMIKEKTDTEYICRTPVSCFELSYDRMKKVAQKRDDLQQARKEVKQELLTPNHPIALNYIFHNVSESPEQYQMELHKKDLKVKFKNAVMQVWT